MSLLIKGLEIPEDGEYNLTVYIGDLHGSPNTKCIAIINENTGEGKHYKLADVPTPHGRLIDADELKRNTMFTFSGTIREKEIDEATTVIEAEE